MTKYFMFEQVENGYKGAVRETENPDGKLKHYVFNDNEKLIEFLKKYLGVLQGNWTPSITTTTDIASDDAPTVTTT